MSDGGGWVVTVEARGSFPSLAGETLLQAASRGGVLLPSGCQHGACRTCAVRVVSGHVSQRSGTSLSSELLARRYVLACTATAKSDCTLRVETGADRVGVLPWTE